MDLERYEFGIIQQDKYGFFSEGNLTFGDWKEDINWIDDQIITDNKDRRKVLATVAAIVVTFMEENPNAIVFATGRTPARTRLYRMGIDFSNNPYAIRYTNEIKELLKRIGIPEDFRIHAGLPENWQELL